jgi:hypothetical protein
MATDLLIRRPEELSGGWLTDVLRASGAASQQESVTEFEAVPIGTGQMSDSYRLRLTWDDSNATGPSSVVLKVAAVDDTSRSTGVGLGIYEREILFYREVAPRVRGPVASCHVAVHDPGDGWFTLLLEDAAPATQGDQIEGCTVDEAKLAMRELARLHAPVWNDEELDKAGWLGQSSAVNGDIISALLVGFIERYDDRIAPEHRAVIENVVKRIDPWLADRTRPFSIVHGDYRLDNMLFGKAGSARPLTVVDWQTVSWGAPLLDAAYFLGAGLPVDERRAHEHALVLGYHENLLALGVADFTWEECWEGYRRNTFHGIVMSVVAPMLVIRTERGDDMFMTSVARFAQQIIDLQAEDLLL